MGIWRLPIGTDTVPHGTVFVKNIKPVDEWLKSGGTGIFRLYYNLKMTREGNFTIVSRVVVVRHLRGLLCAVGPMVSLFNLSSLHP